MSLYCNRVLSALPKQVIFNGTSLVRSVVSTKSFVRGPNSRSLMASFSTTSTSMDANITNVGTNDIMGQSLPEFKRGKPTLDYVKSMPVSFSTMTHEQIIQLSAEGVPEARREALIRNIMASDEVDYDDAKAVFKEVAKVNREGMLFQFLPFHLGLGTAIIGGVMSIPLVFHLPTVEAFNHLYVTADVPEPKDLETWLEVGSWSWAWMEPLIGQASFFLLTMQFARSQLQNIGLTPYSNYMREYRARRLIRLYPQYNANILAAFSKSEAFYASYDPKDDTYE